MEVLPLSCFVKSFSTFFSLQGLVNDKDSKDSMTEGENLEEDEEDGRPARQREQRGQKQGSRNP